MPSINLIETATIFQTELDKAAVEIASSGWMELNDKLIKYDGGEEVKIPELDMDALGDYDDNEGFVDGDVTLKWIAKNMTMDRGRRFVLPEKQVSESNFVATASSVMGEFQRTKVVPEIDAYRYSTIAAGAIAQNRASGGYIPTETDVLKRLYYDIAGVQDAVGDATPLVITMSMPVAAMIAMSKELSKTLDSATFAQGDVKLAVKALDGMYPIIRAGSGLMKTAYQFLDGKTADQKKGGFKPAADAKDINWIICPRTAPIAVSRTDAMRIFDPETYQKSRSWAMDYRKYHDLWILDNKWPSIFVNVKQALV